MTKKRNGFLLFCCSLFPGAGEMYMGFMKMGVSLMSIFMLMMAIADMLQLSIGVLISVVIWFYSFFHVHNLASLSDEEFARVQDDYLLHRSDIEKGRELTGFYRKAIACVLIFLGAVLLWEGVIFRFIRNYLQLPEYISGVIYGINDILPKLVISIAIIVLGIHMIKGKKKEIEETGEGEEDNGTDRK